MLFTGFAPVLLSWKDNVLLLDEKSNIIILEWFTLLLGACGITFLSRILPINNKVKEKSIKGLNSK